MAEAAGSALADLIARLPADTVVRGNRERRVTSIATDSREVIPGALFVALRGGRHDGHAFVAQALANGAAAVVVQHGNDVCAQAAVVVSVADTYRALSVLAAAFYGDPSRALRVAGVTGTNGKTTTVQMLRAILDDAAIPCGTIGTVGAEFGAQRWALAHTTPLPPELQGLLAAMRAEGASAVAMEVSSHALALDRVEDVTFGVAVLTNVTRDHLDFHRTMEAYAGAKRRLFAMAPVAVLNLDDPYGARWAQELRAAGVTTIGYGSRGADLTPDDLTLSLDGSRFTLDGRPFALRLPGRFNVDNALAAIGAARAYGVGDDRSAHALAQLERVPGRMERLHENGVDVVVDYAHTPDALERVLRALREGTSGSLALVFGCGGDRDRGKRPEMGAVAVRYADAVYVTNDNPRGEDPGAIADEILKGMGGRRCIVELDRRRAIERAIAHARPGDVVLVAGKGHETLQIIGDRAIEFDDVAVARHALALRAAMR